MLYISTIENVSVKITIETKLQIYINIPVPVLGGDVYWRAKFNIFRLFFSDFNSARMG